MIHLVTYSDDKMTRSLEVCAQSAYANGVDIVYEKEPDDIGRWFASFNYEIVSALRGPSYWIWKPLMIWQAIQDCSEGDILIYSDAGVKWISNVNEIIGRMDQDIFLFSNGHQHIHWCKADVMNAINKSSFFTLVQSDPHYQALQQVQASVIFFKVNQNTRNFIKEWLLWCQMPGFIDDSPSKLPNHPEFAEHRHDQALITCMSIKYGYRLHWWPDAMWYISQRYRWPDDTYPPMLEHHRKRDPGKGGGINPEW